MENAVNERFELLVKVLDLPQVKVAERLNVTHGTVNRWLNNHSIIRKSNAKGIANEFNVNINWLLTGEGEMFNEGGLKVVTPLKEEVITNPYKDALVKELKEEIDFLRQLLKNLTGTSQTVRANFNTDTVPALGFNENLSLQFVQYRESA